MTATDWTSLLLPIAPALVAALIALVGNHWIQNRLARRIRDAEDLRRRLYEFLTLVAEYWMAETRDPVLEARIIAVKFTVIAELGHMRGESTRLRHWYSATAACRLDMIDAATGGCFQQQAWASDPKRVMIVARAMGRIVRTLRAAC